MSDINEQKKLASELAGKLWGMANDLRGTMEAYEFKNYILGLIFYKHLSDKAEFFLTEAFEHDNITYEEAWKNEELKKELIDDMLDSLGFVMEPKYLFSNVIKMVNNENFTIDYME